MSKIKWILSAASSIARAKLFRQRMPLFVGWELTNRCNLKCSYCDAWNLTTEELPREKIFSMIDELACLGTKFISFTGGEPLLREDLAEIAEYCKSKSIHTSVNSNGFELARRFSSIKNVDLVILSLDGSRSSHDSIRGKGSYDQVLAAAQAVKHAGIELNLAVTLTKNNLDQVDFLIAKAEEFGATITFQPALRNLLYSDRPNPISCSGEDNRKVIQQIIDYKKKLQRDIITNSFTALRHLYQWPHKRNIKCASGYIACRIKANGDVCFCNRSSRKISYQGSLQQAFLSLGEISCDECWCAQRLELNLLFALKAETVFNNLFLLAKRKK